MKLKKIITKSLLGIGLVGLLGCEKSTQEQETAKIKIKNYVAEFPIYERTGVSVVVGDMNGDGRLDIIVAAKATDYTHSQGKVYVFLNNGDGTYSPSEKY